MELAFALHSMAPTYKTAGGEVRVIDSRNFPSSTTIAAAHVIVKPGALRELHGHRNADEWQYYVQGQGRMTVFFNGGKARTADFHSGRRICSQDSGSLYRKYRRYGLDLSGNV
jgi:oxalate decarboxylase